jgi:hypothetical protein
VLFRLPYLPAKRFGSVNISFSQLTGGVPILAGKHGSE